MNPIFLADILPSKKKKFFIWEREISFSEGWERGRTAHCTVSMLEKWGLSRALWLCQLNKWQKWHAWFPQGKQELTSKIPPCQQEVSRSRCSTSSSALWCHGKRWVLSQRAKERAQFIPPCTAVGIPGQLPTSHPLGETHVGVAKACKLHNGGTSNVFEAKKKKLCATNSHTSYSWRNITVP